MQMIRNELTAEVTGYETIDSVVSFCSMLRTKKVLACLISNLSLSCIVQHY